MAKESLSFMGLSVRRACGSVLVYSVEPLEQCQMCGAMFAHPPQGLRDWFPKRRSPSTEGPEAMARRGHRAVLGGTAGGLVRHRLRRGIGRGRGLQSRRGRHSCLAADPDDVVVDAQPRRDVECEALEFGIRLRAA